MNEQEGTNIIEFDFAKLPRREGKPTQPPSSPGRIVGVIAPDESTLEKIMAEQGLRPQGRGRDVNLKLFLMRQNQHTAAELWYHCA
jgi:hypothetical protein